MTPHEIELAQLRHQIDTLQGVIARLADDQVDALTVALQALKRGRTAPAVERVEVAIEALLAAKKAHCHG